MSRANFEYLFTPIQVGPMRVPNRICETTNTIWSSRSNGLIDDAFIELHLAKARGGTGWIGSETWLLDSPLPPGAPEEFLRRGSFAGRQMVHQAPGFADGVARFCDAVHQTGAVAVFQLSHMTSVHAASPVPSQEDSDLVPRQLSEEEIEFFLNSYAEAAAIARDAGADGVEIHCAHDLLPQTFLSPGLNYRTDKWGGGPQQRVRFVIEALERVRKSIGTSLALGIRISGKEFRQAGYQHMEMREMTYAIGETGLLDFVDIDVGHSFGPHSYVSPSYYGHAEHREIGKAARADLNSKIAVLFTGRINDVVLAEELLKGGYCDLVGMTRAGIADPEFANKAREGRMIEIRRCIGCNRCIATVSDFEVPYKPTCSVNPIIGNELEWKATYQPAAKVKHVVVVGGGIAGLEAARVAAMRGHRVTLLEQGKRVGGQMLLAAKAPGRDSFEDQIYFEENELERLGVKVRLETKAGFDEIKALAPDAVVIATGSTPRVPMGVPGVDLPHVVQGWDVLAGKAKTGARVAIVSQEDYFQTPNIAEFIAESGKQVTIYHRRTHIGAEIEKYSLGPVMSRLERHNVVIHPHRRLEEILPNALKFSSPYDEERTYLDAGYDTVVLVYGSVPNSDLYNQLKAEGDMEVHIVGAAWSPRRIAEATRHGAAIGLII